MTITGGNGYKASMPLRPSLSILSLDDMPEVRAGDDLAALLIAAIGGGLAHADILVIAQKIVSKAEGRRVALADVTPSPRARDLAETCRKDARLVELVLGEADAVVRAAPGVLIVRHRLGFLVANAGIDQSNVDDGDAHALLLPRDPDGSARALRDRLSAAFGVAIGVVVNDSFGRPWRRGTCGAAIGCAGIEPLVDLRGRPDRFGRPLMTSEVATGDEIAAAASLVMGQSAEGIPAVILRGLPAFARESGAADLLRPPSQNLFT